MGVRVTGGGCAGERRTVEASVVCVKGVVAVAVYIYLSHDTVFQIWWWWKGERVSSARHRSPARQAIELPWHRRSHLVDRTKLRHVVVPGEACGGGTAEASFLSAFRYVPAGTEPCNTRMILPTASVSRKHLGGKQS